MSTDLGAYREDIIGFSANLCGITLHPGQERFMREALSFENGRLKYRYINLTASNRFGKTVCLAIIQLFFAIYKHGLYVEGEDWMKHPYGIINVCPLNDLAAVLRDMVHAILLNEAKEQINNPAGRGYCALGALFERTGGNGDGFFTTFGEYRGFRTKLTNVTMEFRTTDDNAKAIQGTPKYLVTFDEAGRQRAFTNLMGAHVIPRTLDTSGVIVTATTPDVDTGTDYEDWWNKGDPDNWFRDPLFYSTNGSIRENPFVTPKQIKELMAATPSFLHDQVLEGKFVQSSEAFFAKPSLDAAFDDQLEPTRKRENKHFYVIGVDLAIAKAGDRSVMVVWDATRKPFRVMEVWEPPKGTPSADVVEKMREFSQYYNGEWLEKGVPNSCEALMVYDGTAMGGKLFGQLIEDFQPRPRSMNFTAKTKLQMLTSLRLLLDKQDLQIPGRFGALKQELRNYTRNDEKLLTDSVMAMALAAYMAERNLPMAELDSEVQGIY